MKMIVSLGLLSLSSLYSMAQLKYPETRKDSQADQYFGTSVADPYSWLEDDQRMGYAAE